MTTISTAEAQDNVKEGYESLEYEEDCYYVKTSDTPSFDQCAVDDDQDYCVDEDEAAANLSKAFVDDQLCADDLCNVEVDIFGEENIKVRNSLLSSSQDFLKTFKVKRSSSSPQNFYNFLHRRKAEEAPIDMSPDSGINELAGLSPEEQERQRQEWQQELAKVEEEIQTLRHVLSSRIKHSQELKRKLGITVWKEIQDDMSQGIRNVKESNVYQKTESVLKTTAEKTTTLLGGLGSSVTTKLGQLKNSDSFRSLEERVGTAYENVKTKVSTSRSNSMQSFDEALREAEGTRKGSVGAVSPAATPTIPEERPLS